MADFDVECPECGVVIEDIPLEYSGIELECPSCNKLIQMPEVELPEDKKTLVDRLPPPKGVRDHLKAVEEAKNKKKVVVPPGKKKKKRRY